MGTILYILIALAVLMLMVTIHEFGHYIAGKILKFKINEFSIGFGPAIFSKKGKSGEVFSIRWIPLGGYCAFEGEDTESEAENSFDKQAPWKRIIVLIAGGMFNIISGIIFSIILLCAIGYDVVMVNTNKIAVLTNQYTIQSSDLIYSIEYLDTDTFNSVTIYCQDKINDENRDYFLVTNDSSYLYGTYLATFIYENTPATTSGSYTYNVRKLEKVTENSKGEDTINFDGEIYFKELRNDKIELERIINADLKAGDIIYRINSVRLGFSPDRQATTLIRNALDSGAVEITLKRDGKMQTITTSGHGYEIISKDGTTETSSLGISLELYKYNFFEALGRSIPFTFEICGAVIQILFQLIFGQISFSAMGGPITTIATIAGYSQKSISTIFVLLPLIAANLGVFNLMPIPALDGSKVVFCIIEWIRKKPINRDIENRIHAIGFIVLMGLVLIADLYQVLFAKIFKTLF